MGWGPRVPQHLAGARALPASGAVALEALSGWVWWGVGHLRLCRRREQRVRPLRREGWQAGPPAPLSFLPAPKPEPDSRPPFALPQAFKVFERMARQDDEKRHRELEAKLRKKEEEEEAAERVRVAPAAQEVEVETTVEPGPAAEAGEAAGPQDSAAPAEPSPAPAEPPGAAAPAQPQPAELPT